MIADADVLVKRHGERPTLPDGHGACQGVRAMLAVARRAALRRRRAAKPTIVQKPIPFPAPSASRRWPPTRSATTGIDSYRLRDPEGDRRALHGHERRSSRRSTRSRPTRPTPSCTSCPGTCSHYVIDRDGTIYQLVPRSIMCRHTVGLNYTAIGIEHVGSSDGEILRNAPPDGRLAAAHALAALPLRRSASSNVIGHSESLLLALPPRERRAPAHADARRLDARRHADVPAASWPQRGGC